MSHKARTTDAIDPEDVCGTYAEWCEREGYDPESRTYRRRDRGAETERA